MGRKRSSFFGGVLIRLLALCTLAAAAAIGVGLGLSAAETANIKNQENFQVFAPALPTKILDIHGELITEFSADEKRELVSLHELPKHLINAVLAREDPDFYRHKGFSVKGIARAALGQFILRKNMGGGSTITQQVAGTLYTDRSERTISRKVRELWWAFQMERRYTKDEILEIYLNYMYMGPGTYGVEAASKYFFGHSAREITLAESALLAVQLSSPTRYNPLDNPNVAMDRQRLTLDRMVELGYATREEAQASFDAYWDNYDYTRASVAAYYSREDKAPWFSEYVRRELDGMMYGTRDYYRDGYTVRTTLDLKHQEAATKYMEQGLVKANKEFAASQSSRLHTAERTWRPIVSLFSLCFDLTEIHGATDTQLQEKARSRYNRQVNPVVDMAALLFGISDLKPLTSTAFAELKSDTEQNVVEGALISIENETGYITAIVGGSRFDESNQLIRATQAKVMPGSSFKPLYYSAAIDTKLFTPASLIYDIPIVFHNEDGTPYIPLNYKGEWKGTVLFYNALAQSMNVPSLKILDAIGFDAAIERAGDLLGIYGEEDRRRTFPRLYPLGLGIISISPVQVARAFAVFGNQGRAVTPMAIRSVEDRNGRVVMDVEKDLRLDQKQAGGGQVISPQNAYVMTGILKKTVEVGTLQYGSGWGAKFAFVDGEGKKYRIAAAGKTGTTQNWSDAWAVGYTPYYTTAIWFGFDKPGNSLGVNLSGATLCGPIWGDYMRDIHQGLPARDFTRPGSGVVDVTVCAKSGQLKTAACDEGLVTLSFLAGTQPAQYCSLHGDSAFTAEVRTRPLLQDTLSLDEDILLGSLRTPSLPAEFAALSSPASSSGASGAGRERRARSSAFASGGNAFLDPLPEPKSPLEEAYGARAAEEKAGEETGVREEGLEELPSQALPPGPASLPGFAAPPPAPAPAPAAAAPEERPPDYGRELPSYNPLLD